MFKKLSEEKQSLFEEKISKYWSEHHILEKSIEQRKKKFVFYDGPATANGMPGIHHLMSKLLKDAVCKYKTMKGYRVDRRVGWDTHGLPVEVQVEKELGFTGKTDIEKYGIAQFNHQCRTSVMKNEESFTRFTKKMGQFIDTDNAYITYNNNYIETLWWILKEYHKKGLIYEGLKILPYCPRCGTGLASHEVAQGYKNINVNSVIVPFKIKGREAYFLVWTTTPWTLLANVGLCVNPHEDYIEVISQGYNFILSKKLATKILGNEYKIIREFKGIDIEKTEYEQLIPEIKVDNAFYVCCDEYVTTEDGTGVVHLATSFGQEDYNVGLKYGLPTINPVDSEGKYTTGPWKGRFVLDPELELDIIKYLKSNDKLFKKQKLEHNYPHCWRCSTPLIYYASPSLYIKTTAYKDQIIAANKKVNWYPSYVGEKRFNNWLENLVDWAISRNRYWGTPIPLWKCSCGHEEMIGSIEELRDKSISELGQDIDLHRPFVDNIKIKCSHCSSEMTRISSVMDCWFDSGAMPFAQCHYPFENKEWFKNHFPADFICEGIDQTRGWFNSLLSISVFLEDQAPYKNVLVNDLVLAQDGSKMHKSRGNAVNPFDAIEEFGADAIRWFFLSSSPVWTPLRYDPSGVREVNTKMFTTLRNVYNFFSMYANIDNIDPRNVNVNYDDLEEIDRWLLSRYHNLIKYVTDSMEEYDLNKAAKEITRFVNDDLSNWYIRRNRKRFWSKVETNRKEKDLVYWTTYEVLKGLCKLIAPLSPFLVEEIYQNLTGEESVHLADYPEYEEKFINVSLEEKMDLLQTLITLARNVREKVRIKGRQPLSRAILNKSNQSLIGDLEDLIKEEINVKEIEFTTDMEKYMTVLIKPNYKILGPKYGKLMNDISKYLSDLTDEEKNQLNNDNLIININSEKIKLTKDDVEFLVIEKEGYNAAKLYNNYVVLDTTLDNDLIYEGIARELISKLQSIRKEQDLNITDKINVKYSSKDSIIDKAIEKNKDIICRETLSNTLTKSNDNYNIYNINDYEVGLYITI